VDVQRPDLPLFSVDVETDADARTTVAVAGEVDVATVGELSRVVHDGLRRGAVRIDLERVTFMDSSGVRALNTALREAAQAGHELRIARAMHPSVVQILQMTGMLELLPLEDAT